MRIQRFIPVTLLLALAVSACGEGSPQPAPAPIQTDGLDPAPIVTVQPGQLMQDLGELDIAFKGFWEEDLTPLTEQAVMCDLVYDIGTLAIIEFEAGHSALPVRYPECDGPYAARAYLHPIKVLGVVAGEAMPSNTMMVTVHPTNHNNPRRIGEGDRWLVALRQSRGEWFYGAHQPLRANAEDYAHLDSAPLPTTFAGLVALTGDYMDTFAEACPYHASQRWDDSAWEDFHFNPESRNYRCADPNAEPEPAEPDPTANCTDDANCPPEP